MCCCSLLRKVGSLRLKSSKYNIVVNENGYSAVFNSKNCALVKVNSVFLELLENPNGLYSDEHVNLQKRMYEAGFLVDDEIDEVEALEREHRLAKLSKKKLTLTVLTTENCNFSCFYCFENKKESFLSIDDVRALKTFVLKHLDEVEEVYVCWFGGEPLLNVGVIDDLSEFLIGLCNDKGLKYSAVMITNGSLINDFVVRMLQRCSISTLQITLDGCAETHDKRRCFKSGSPTFDIILNNIKLLSDSGIKVSCRINIDKTVFDSVKRLLRLLGSLNLKNFSVSFGQLLPLGNDDRWPLDICYSQEEFSDAVDSLEDVALKENLEVPLDYPFYPRPSRNFCGASNVNSFVIHPGGDVHKCYDCLDYIVGNIHTGVNDSKEQKENFSFWINNTPFENVECRNCVVLPICMGSCPYLNKKFKKRYCLKWKFDIVRTIKKKINMQTK